QIDDTLREFNLASFEQRAFQKLATFGFQMKYAPHAPSELHALLQTTEATHHYNLRASTVLYLTPLKAVLPAGERRFKNFYAPMLNKNIELRDLFIKHDPAKYHLQPFHITLNRFIADLKHSSKNCLKIH